MVVSTDLPLLEAALVLLPVAYKQLPHLELKNTLLQPAPVLNFPSHSCYFQAVPATAAAATTTKTQEALQSASSSLISNGLI
jgi:hypothetical protein